MADDPQNNNADLVWLHVHVPKAGGSTLRHLMRRNFGNDFYNSASLLETKQYSRVDVREIVRCHPQYKCISDHKWLSVTFAIPSNALSRDIFSIVILKKSIALLSE